jgi:hypothetical protein
MSATNLRLALIGALLICYVLASLAEAWAGNGIAGLETEVRGRIRERIRQWTWYLRAMDVVGVLLLLVALARLAGLLSDVLPSLGEWALGLGVGFLCAERVLRGGSWRSSEQASRSSARHSEAPGFADVCFGYEAYGFRCVRRANEPDAKQAP